MLSAALLLFANTLLLSLRLSGGSFPKPLSAAEERECLRRCAQGDAEARDILIQRNLRLVAHIVKKYYTQSGDQEDLISIGTIGLIKGISSFNADKGARLATYAARCIENEILMYFRSQKKLQSEVSLSDSIEGDQDGNALYCLAVDESTYTREEGEALDLMVPAVLRDGTTFLAVEDVLRLHDLKLEVR